jgi:hypothetical protein
VAITASRLDGQNIGLRLTGGTTVADVLTVNTTTGAASSSYLSKVDLAVVSAAARLLFGLVPVSERSTVTMLTRLVTVAPADNATLTLTSVAGVGTITLRATTGASPANLVIHIPHSTGGLVAWGVGSAGSGGGAVNAVTASAPLASSGGANPDISITAGSSAGEVLTWSGAAWAPATPTAGAGLITDSFTSGAAITAGQVVYLAADGFVYPAQSNSATTSTVVGVATQTVLGGAPVNVGVVNQSGALFGGLTAGTEYFLSATAAGAVVTYATLSATSGAQIVSLGYARSATAIQLAVNRRGVTP